MWESIVKTVAPLVGTAIGGPFGGLASKALMNAFSDDDEVNTEEELRAKIAQADPETLVKLKKVDADFKTQMRQLGIKEKDLGNKDRADARAMGIKTTLIPQMVLSTIFVVAFSVILFTVITQELALTSSQQQLLNILLGILSAGMVQVMNFWFGSSSGSKEKDVPKL